MASLRRLALIFSIAIIPVVSVLMYQKVFAFHLKQGAAWYSVKLIYVSWTQVFPFCLSFFLCFRWFLQWQDFRNMKLDPESYFEGRTGAMHDESFEGCTNLKEYTRKFSQMTDSYSSLERRNGHSYITQQYSELERRLKQYTEYQKSKSGDGSETLVKKAILYIDLLRDILEYRKVAVIQGCQKLASLSTQTTERLTRAHDLVFGYDRLVQSIEAFHYNGWHKPRQILEPSGELHDDGEVEELWEDSIATSDELISYYAHERYLQRTTLFEFVFENYSFRIPRRNAGIVKDSFLRTQRSKPSSLRFDLRAKAAL
jgi:hypothetical protein